MVYIGNNFWKKINKKDCFLADMTFSDLPLVLSYVGNQNFMKKNKINITTIGWWNGSYGMLSSLKDKKDYNLSAIISMSDSWGSTWILREEFQVLPPWDIRRWIMWLSREHDFGKKLFDYRYAEESSVWWHSLWNLLITAMADITGSFEKWLKQICRMFRVKWKVIPVTLELSTLNAKLKNGTLIKWEANIDVDLDEKSSPIKNIFLDPEVKTNPKAIKSIEKSDLIIITFWDLYTSIIPNLLTNWLCDAIRKNKKAKVVYFCNLMTKKWETTGFEAIDFVNTLEKYLWENILTHVVVNNSYISEEKAELYKKLEKKSPVKVKNNDSFRWKYYKVLERDLVYEDVFVRHNFKKVWEIVGEIVEESRKL